VGGLLGFQRRSPGPKASQAMQPLQERTVIRLSHGALLFASANEAEIRLLTGISMLATLVAQGATGSIDHFAAP
jgi:hypothetical protein